MFPYISLGPILLQTPGLALLVGVWVGLKLAEKEAIRLFIDPDKIYNLFFWGAVSGIIGARLSYAARHINVYAQEPLSLFSLSLNTLLPLDGLFISLTVIIIYGWRKQLPLRATLDVFAPGLSVFLVLYGIAHILSGDAFGSASSVPWAIYLWDSNRHPSQIYETLAALLILVLVLKRPLAEFGHGLNFLFMISLTAATRVFLEAFRGDSLIWPGNFRAAQIIGFIVTIAALWTMRLWAEPKPETNDRTETGLF
jgi:prolipoprotein diacylglyceryltransferase